jgi:Protein of unknown function (DUF3515)
VRRRAARLATLVALPIALLAGAVSLWLLGALSPARPAGSSQPGQPGSSGRGGPPGGSGTPGPVSMSALRLDPAAAAVCRRLIASLPGRVRDAARRPVSAGPQQNAAYGDPPLTIACGVPPAGLQPTDDVFVISGVCWFGQTGPAGAVWTTVDRTVPVRIGVPGPIDGSAQRVAALAPFVGTTIEVSAHPPTGCG